MILVAYYTQNPFDSCHPSFVTIDDQTGRIFQSENTGKEYRFNMVDFLNERYKNASTNYGDEICSIAEPSLCGGFKTGLKVSFDDWLMALDQGNTWSEFPEQRAEFEKAYEALQAEEKKKQRKAPPAAQKQRVAYTSPWQAVINWAKRATGGSTSSPGAGAPPPTAGYTPPSSSPPTLPPGQLPPSPRPSLPPLGGGPTKVGPVGSGGNEKPSSPPSGKPKEDEEEDAPTPGPINTGGNLGGNLGGYSGYNSGGSGDDYGNSGGGWSNTGPMGFGAETFEAPSRDRSKKEARKSFFKETSYEGIRLTALGRKLENRNYKRARNATEYHAMNMKYFSGDKGQEGKYYRKEGKKINDARVPKTSNKKFSLRRFRNLFKSEDLTADNLKAIGGSMLLGVGLLVGGSVVANEVYKRVKK